MGRSRRRFLVTSGFGGGAVAPVWTPADIETLVFWLDVRDLAVVADGTAVTTWADRTSVGDTTAPGAAGTRPLYKTNIFGTLPAVRFDGSDDYLDTPAFTLAQACEVMLVGVPRTVSGTGGRMFDGATVNKIALNLVSTGHQIYAGSFVADNRSLPLNHPGLFTVKFNGASSALSINLGTATTGNAGANGTTDGFTLGGAGNQLANFFANYDLGAVLAFSEVLSAPDQALVDTYLLDTFIPSWEQLITFDGDSLTSGVGSTGGNTYPAQCAALLGAWLPMNFGVSGQTITQMAADAAAQIDILYNGTRRTKNILVCWGGSNDVIGGDDATTTYNEIVAYCQARQTAGWTVVVCDIIARGTFSAPQNTVKDAVNVSIAANWATFADAYVALSADARLQNSSDTTYYDVDTIHLNNTGYGVVAGLVATAVAAL